MTYTATGTPADGAGLQSAEMRTEFLLIQAETDKLPTVTGNGGKIIAVNAGGTAEEAITTTGTGNGVRATSPTLVTPTLGVATATSINKVAITQPATASTLTVADGKTLTASNTLTLTATDGSTLAIGTGGTLGTAAYIAASSKQDVDATLTSLSALGTAADKLAYTTGVDTWAETPLTAFARSILDDANEATFKATVNLEIGTDVQAYDAQLADIAGLTPTDNGVVIGNGTNFVVESGATLKASLGLTIGTDIQAYDADLTTWAGVTPGAGVTTALAVAVGSAGALVANGGALGTPSSGVTDNLTTTTSVAAITDTDFVDTNLAAGGKRKILWTAVKTYLGTTFAALAGSASQAFSMTTAAANTNSTQGATTAYADRLTAGTLPGAFTTLSASGDCSASTVSLGTAVATTGQFRLKVGQAVVYRNAGNTVNLNLVSVDTGNILTFGSNDNGYINFNTAQTHRFQYLGTTIAEVSPTVLTVTGQVSPSAHNTYDLGTTGVRWKDLWLQSGAFNGSDARLKTAIAPLSANEINAAKQLSKEIGTYQWLESVQKKGDAARHHVGFTVQRAIEILQLNGCDPFAYGFIGYDKWDDVFVEHAEIFPVAAVEAKEAVLDTDENIIEPAIAAVKAVEGKAAWTEHKTVAGDAYSFRYDQLNMFIAAGLEARLAALEAK